MGLQVKLPSGIYFAPLAGTDKRVEIVLKSADGGVPTVKVDAKDGGLRISWTYTGAPGSVNHAELEILEPDAEP